MRIKVRVVPRAKKERIEKLPDNLKVYLNEPAIEGRANKKLCEVLADYFAVKKSAVTIVRGETNRDKVVEIEGI
jgi:uncharacterized protein (TIGR00251 family)